MSSSYDPPSGSTSPGSTSSQPSSTSPPSSSESPSFSNPPSSSSPPNSSSGCENEHSIALAISGETIYNKNVGNDLGNAKPTGGCNCQNDNDLHHHMLEVDGEAKDLTLNVTGTCWGNGSPIKIVYDSSKVSLSFPNGNAVPNGTPFYPLNDTSGGSGSTSSAPVFKVKAKVVSVGWDDITIYAMGTPVSDASSSCGSGGHDECESKHLKITSYTITPQVMEKPWGSTWGGPEDQGMRTVGGGSSQGSGSAPGSGSTSNSGSTSGGPMSETHQWYHLWTENLNAIRADVKPQCLGDIVTATDFGALGTSTDFSPDAPPDTTLKPVWEKVTAGVGLKEGVTATITAGGEDLPGTQNKIDVVVNKIASVEWVTRNESGTRNPGTPTEAHLAKLEAHGGGFRTFPEKTMPTSPVYDKVEVRITLAEGIPDQMWGNVYVGWFDPDNPIGSLKTPTDNKPNAIRDNWGGMAISDGNPCVKFTSADTYYNGLTHKGKGFEINSAHAGDNYIVVAHPNPGVVNKYRLESDGITISRPDGAGTTTLNADLQSGTLTVWRTLNVETDIAPWPGLNITDLVNITYEGIVTSELARTCVVMEHVNARPFAQQISNPTNNFEIWSVAGARIKPGTTNEYELDPNNTMSTRDLFGNCKEFWTVRTIIASAFDGNFHAGEFLSGVNTIVVYLERIKGMVQTWNANHSGETVTLLDSVSHTLLHEICHLLIDDSERKLLKYNNVFYDIADENNPVVVQLSMIGVRDTIFIPDPNNPNVIVADMKDRVAYTKLLDTDIKNIQSRSEAND